MAHSPRIGLTTLQHVCGTPGGDWYVRGSTYDQAVAAAGGIPVSIPAFVSENLLDEYLDMVDGMVFIGGPDIPSSYYGMKPHRGEKSLPEMVVRNHFALIRKVFSRNIPVLGICLGMQELNVVNGGKLIQDLGALTPYHRYSGGDQYHRGVIESGSRLAEIFGAGELLLNSQHHQAVDPENLAPGARITARCGEVIEAIEFEGPVFRVGVQWHPERIRDEEHRRKIFGALVAYSAAGPVSSSAS